MNIAPCLEAIFGFVIVLLSQDIIFAWLRLWFSKKKLAPSVLKLKGKPAGIIRMQFARNLKKKISSMRLISETDSRVLVYYKREASKTDRA